MFILQVLMCITMSKDDTSSMVMLPMEGTNNGDIPVDDNTDEIRRKRRSVYSKQLQNIEMVVLNVISFKKFENISYKTLSPNPNRFIPTYT
ncbi:hypothetical protein DOY81_008503 [Sarcophaga bullata]|nr:hypothetical protein DOY81_008503 [Sarcophaga bullata]